MFDKQFQKLWLASSVEIEAIPTSGDIYMYIDNLLGTSMYVCTAKINIF